MKRKCKLMAFLLFSMLFLIGWGKKSVELLNSKKLIDLNAAIEFCLPGDESSEKTNGTEEEQTATPSTTPKATVTPRPTVTPMPAVTQRPKVITISVKGRVVTCDLKQWDDMDALKERIVGETDRNVTFRLMDNYAESKVYRELIAMLEELEAEQGIRYTRD